MNIIEFRIKTGSPITVKRSDPKIKVETLTRWYDPVATSADGTITYTIEAQKPVKFSNGTTTCDKDHKMNTDHYEEKDKLEFDLSAVAPENNYQFTIKARVKIGSAKSQPDAVTVKISEDAATLNPIAHENDPA